MREGCGQDRFADRYAVTAAHLSTDVGFALQWTSGSVADLILRGDGYEQGAALVANCGTGTRGRDGQGGPFHTCPTPVARAARLFGSLHNLAGQQGFPI